MTRVRMRASRALVALLILSLSIALFVTTRKKPQSPNALLQASPAINSPAQKPTLILASNSPLPIDHPTTRPVIAPTTQPIVNLAPTTQPIVAIAPTTRPAASPGQIMPDVV